MVFGNPGVRAERRAITVDGDILGDIATWVGSIGTIAAFVVAFIQIRRERTERHKRERREWIAQKRVHVDRVSAWVRDGVLQVANASRHPVHDLEAVLPSGERISIAHVLPGDHTQPVAGEGDGPVADLTFTDVRGDRWRRAAGEAPELVNDAHARGDVRADDSPHIAGGV